MEKSNNQTLREQFYEKFARRNAETGEIEPKWFLQEGFTSEETADFFIATLKRECELMKKDVPSSADDSLYPVEVDGWNGALRTLITKLK